MKLAKYFPVLDWGPKYRGETFVNDMVAAVIVTIMLIPQSLAYALLAGLPPEIGLYASILPLLVYAMFGSSRQLAVGPVAILSLMTAAAAGKIAAQGSAEYIQAALILALLSGLILLAMGIFPHGVSGELPEPPGRLSVHHCIRHHHRRLADEAHSRR